MTEDRGTRVQLNALRWGATVMCNVTVLAVFWILTYAVPNDNFGLRFKLLGYIVIVFGLVCASLFLLFTPESMIE